MATRFADQRHSGTIVSIVYLNDHVTVECRHEGKRLVARKINSDRDTGTGGSQMIVRRAGKYIVVSETTGRRLGTYDTLAEANTRLGQIEFFKHLEARAAALGGRRRLRLRRRG